MQVDPREWHEPAPYNYLQLRNIYARLRWEWRWRCRIHCADLRGPLFGPVLDHHYERKRAQARRWLIDRDRAPQPQSDSNVIQLNDRRAKS